MEALAADPPGGPVVLQRRAWRARRDSREPSSSSARRRTRREARRCSRPRAQAGVPVNVIDRPAYCTFQFGAVVNRSPLVIGISTDGAAPVFGQADPLAHRGAAARRLRALGAGRARRGASELHEHELGPAVRRRFWERFADAGAARARTRAERQDRDELLAEDRRRQRRTGARSATSRSSAPAPAIRSCSRSRPCARCARPTSSSTTTWWRRRSSTSPAARPSACWWARPAIAPPAGRTTSTR